MAYCEGNPKTKKDLAALIKAGKAPAVYQPGLGTVPTNGAISIEGPHGVHRWYASGTMKDGKLVSIK